MTKLKATKTFDECVAFIDSLLPAGLNMQYQVRTYDKGDVLVFEMGDCVKNPLREELNAPLSQLPYWHRDGTTETGSNHKNLAEPMVMGHSHVGALCQLNANVTGHCVHTGQINKKGQTFWHCHTCKTLTLKRYVFELCCSDYVNL